MGPQEALLVCEAAFAAASTVPLVFSDLYNRRVLATQDFPTCPPQGDSDLPILSILICVRDESLVIAGKLDDLFVQEYPRDRMTVMVIDTGSSDDTLDIVEKWKSSHPEEASILRVLISEPGAGKSAGVNLGVKESDGEVVVITDADSRMDTGGLQRIGRWFLNDSIGAVCGRQMALDNDGRLHSDTGFYRRFYNRAREAESTTGSTLIFEGSLAGYRRSIIEQGIDSDSNADDSQLAILAARSGLRAIHDPELRFFEAVPTTSKGIHRQRSRRAQGLTRLAWRNLDLLLVRGLSKRFSIFYYAHVKMPVALLASIGCGVAATVFGVSEGKLDTLTLLNPAIAVSILVPALFKRREPFLQSTGGISFLHSAWVLLWSHVRMITRQRSNVWFPLDEVRRSVVKFDRNRK